MDHEFVGQKIGNSYMKARSNEGVLHFFTERNEKKVKEAFHIFFYKLHKDSRSK